MDSVAIFVEVVRVKSFSEAARRLGMPKSTVSVRIAELEARLGVALVHRTTRQVQPTPAGEAYYAAAARSIADLQSAEAEVSQAQSAPSGTLRITSAGADTGNVSQFIAEYLALYPQVHVDLFLSDQKLDILSLGIDVGVRIGEVGDTPNLVARRIGTVHRALYASPTYLRARKAPAHPNELFSHALLLAKPGVELLLVQQDGSRMQARVAPHFVANHPGVLRFHALRDLGIALLPAHAAEEDVRAGALKRVLPDWTTPLAPVSLLYTAQRFLPQRVRLFVDLVVERSQPERKKRSRS